MIPHIGTVPITKLTRSGFRRGPRALQSAAVSAHRCRYARGVLRAALKQAVRWQMVATNPASLIDAPRHMRAEIRPLDAEEARQLLKTAAGHPLEPFVTIALTLGAARRVRRWPRWGSKSGQRRNATLAERPGGCL